MFISGLEKLIIDQMQCFRKIEVKALLMKCAENLLQRLNGDLDVWPFFYEDALNGDPQERVFKLVHLYIT